MSLAEAKSGLRPLIAPLKRQGLAIDELHVALFFAAHIPLALLMYEIRMTATAHATGTLLYGLWVAFVDRRPHRVAYVIAYISGAEAIWRSTEANIYWEFGKYAVAAIILISFYQNIRWKLHGLSFVYFGLLTPSVLLTLEAFDFNFRGYRETVSFNMSGPLAIMLCLCFSSNLRLNRIQTHRMFLAAMGPIVGLSGMIVYTVLTAQRVSFYAGSNVATSGGWGPNQIASVLGLGAFLAFWGMLCVPGGPLLRVMMVVGVIVFLVQSVMTFSRGGVYIMVGASLAATYFLIRNTGLRKKLVVVGLAAGIALVFLLFLANLWTAGALLDRFQDLDMTHREEFAAVDMQIFLDNPVLGIGPGLGDEFRGAKAHTEFTRLLAEHGLFGLAALVVLILIVLDHFLRAKTISKKAIVASMSAWTFLYMSVNDLRLVAPAFILSLIAADLLPFETRPAAPGRIPVQEEPRLWRERLRQVARSG